MTDDPTDAPSDEADENEIRDLLNPIRDLEAPAGLSKRCLDATRAAASPPLGITMAPAAKPSTSRLSTIAAIAASLVLGISAGWIARGQVVGTKQIAESTGAVTQSNDIATTVDQRMARDLVNATSVVEYQEDVENAVFATHEFYLCGVGKVQSKSEFLYQGESR
ncbi:MAG: hypothetical protein WBD31_17925 [Rubripirellula sp.]